jgi:hypothetical protein
VLLSCHQNARENHNIEVSNRSFENVAQFRYFGMTITNQNLNQEEIKRRLNSSNTYYHTVQNLLSSHLLSKIVHNIEDYKYNIKGKVVSVLN